MNGFCVLNSNCGLGVQVAMLCQSQTSQTTKAQRADSRAHSSATVEGASRLLFSERKFCPQLDLGKFCVSFAQLIATPPQACESYACVPQCMCVCVKTQIKMHNKTNLQVNPMNSTHAHIHVHTQSDTQEQFVCGTHYCCIIIVCWLRLAWWLPPSPCCTPLPRQVLGEAALLRQLQQHAAHVCRLVGPRCHFILTRFVHFFFCRLCIYMCVCVWPVLAVYLTCLLVGLRQLSHG